MIPYYFTKRWWQYILAKPCTLRKIVCRWRGHPYGVFWYDMSGFEPDMRCENCDDDLG